MDGIEKTHRDRYLFASTFVRQDDRVLDAACGCGYGAGVLTKAGGIVTAVDIHSPAIVWGMKHFDAAIWINGHLQEVPLGQYQLIVSLETLEHLSDPKSVMLRFRKALRSGDTLIASVPNEDKYPFVESNFAGQDYPHLRHYTPAEFYQLLRGSGFHSITMFTQDKRGAVRKGDDGRFLIARAR